MMALVMDDSLKLSYDMLFDSDTSPEDEANKASSAPETFTMNELKERLKERDEQWEEKLEATREQAVQEGFEKGVAAGKAEAEELLGDQLAGIKVMMEEIDQGFRDSLEELKPHMAELVFDMTEKVLDVPFRHPQLQQRVQDEISVLVENLNEQMHIQVTVAESDYEMIMDAFTSEEEMDHFTLRVDEEHMPGEYAVETKKESIIKNFKKMVADFKESISFGDVDHLELDD